MNEVAGSRERENTTTESTKWCWYEGKDAMEEIEQETQTKGGRA